MFRVFCGPSLRYTTRPLFQGQNHIDQLEVVYRICGTPTHDNWPGHAELPWYSLFRPPKFIDRSLRTHI
eukprot:SAG22_NODE_16899_length_315_cov_0.717593_1_plen_68_part_10